MSRPASIDHFTRKTQIAMTKAKQPLNRTDPSPPATAAFPPERLVVTLRLATAKAHEGIEQLPIMRRVLAQTLTRQDYRAYLRVMADVYCAVETGLYQELDQALRERLGVSPKLPALLLDLEEQGERWYPPGSEIGEGGTAGRVFSLHGTSAVVGGLYTLEGATLGGRTIARQLQRTLGAGLGSGRFLDFHGEYTSAAWRHFSAVLDELRAAGTLVTGEVIGGALATFEYLHERLSQASAP